MEEPVRIPGLIPVYRCYLAPCGWWSPVPDLVAQHRQECPKCNPSRAPETPNPFTVVSIMHFYPALVQAVHAQLPGHELMRLSRSAWFVHVWNGLEPDRAVCGARLGRNTVRARGGSGSLCIDCEKYLEELGFEYPPRGGDNRPAKPTNQGGLL